VKFDSASKVEKTKGIGLHQEVLMGKRTPLKSQERRGDKCREEDFK